MSIICPIHGVFKMKPNSHFNGQGCPKCGRIEANNNIKLAYTDFLKRAEKIHDTTYIYDESSYIDYTSKMKILCSEHGVFEQKPHSHISMKTGCPKCGIIKTTIKNKIEWAIVEDLFKETHGNKYNYIKSTYVDVSTKMEIICSEHGVFYQKPYAHYGGGGCKKCGLLDSSEKRKFNFEDFIELSKKIHGNLYSYQFVNFVDIFTPIEIECKKHGLFYQIPRNHYRGSGCSKCSSSRGENLIRNILQNYNIKFEEQKTFEGLKYQSKLRCDFYLTDKNTVIEYNGIQHYVCNDFFGGVVGLEYTQKRDFEKYKFLNQNNINLIIVKFDVINIEHYICDKLNITKFNTTKDT